jgi:hypothetical protein
MKSNRSRFLAVGACAALLFATQVDAGNANSDRPMHISCDTTFEFTSTGSVHIEGICQYAHLGRTTVIADQIIIPQPDGTITISNTSVYTTANGDQLFAVAVGTGEFTSPTSVVFSGVETYHGGTGRFAQATGSVPFAGGADFTSAVAGTGHFAGTGTISY